MATSQDQPSDSARDAPGRVDIVDPDNYVQSRRLRQIFNARKRFPETIREEQGRVVDDPRQDGITQDRYHQLVADALLEYLIELEPLFVKDKVTEQLERDYWDGIEIGEHNLTIKDVVDGGATVDPGDADDSTTIPLSTSREAYRVANRFFAEAGFGLEFDDGLDVEAGNGDGFDTTR